MPTEYIHFTEEQKQQARQTDLVALLQSQGEHLKRSGKEYVWRDGSDKVTVRGNLWFHQYERIGGDAVDFVRRFYHMDFPQAVGFLLGNNGGTLQRAEPIRREPPKPFALPPKNENMRRVFAYLLNRRGIDRDVLYGFVHKGMIYESADYHNAVFVGCDESGTPRHAHKRGTGSESSYKGNTTTISYKNKTTVHRPESECAVVENTHPALITQEQWDIVQDVRTHKKRTPKQMAEPNIFSGLAYCADCGRTMVLHRAST